MNNKHITDIDFLVFGAHPDDVELSCGGTIIKLTNESKTVVMVDMTAGEMGTRGTAEIRAAEAKKSAGILGVADRINLGMPDGNLKVTEENILKVIEVIRRFRPKAVIMNQAYERHPDHEASHALVRNAMFKSGLRRIETSFEGKKQEPYRTRKMYYYMQSYQFNKQPDFYIDVTDTFDKKMDAIFAFASQVYVPGVSNPDEPMTRLSRPEFIDELKARCIYWGTLVGVKYAEAFGSIEPVVIRSIGELI